MCVLNYISTGVSFDFLISQLSHLSHKSDITYELRTRVRLHHIISLITQLSPPIIPPYILRSRNPSSLFILWQPYDPEHFEITGEEGHDMPPCNSCFYLDSSRQLSDGQGVSCWMVSVVDAERSTSSAAPSSVGRHR